MKTKFLILRDTLTAMPCLVIQLEESDRPFCDAAGVAPGLKIVLRFDGRLVTCFAGYELRDDLGGRIESLSSAMRPDGTICAFKELLHYVEDIRVLPSKLDVESWRHQLGWLRRCQFIHTEIREILEELPDSRLRKVAYRPRGLRMCHLALLDIQAGEVLFDIGQGDCSRNEDKARTMALFHWIPVKKATPCDLDRVKLTPFPYELL